MQFEKWGHGLLWDVNGVRESELYVRSARGKKESMFKSFLQMMSRLVKKVPIETECYNSLNSLGSNATLVNDKLL